MKMRNLLSLALALFIVSACDSEIEDLKSERPVSNVATTEVDGVVTATINPNATTDQVLVASRSSAAADASVTFPPGSLAISTEIAIGEATDRSTAILGELGVDGLVKAGTPVYIGPSNTSSTVDVNQSLTIQLPLPLESLDIAGLVEGESKLVLIYTIYQNGWKSGIIPLTKANLLGAFLKQAFQGLGYFQIAYLATAGTTAEVSSQVRPTLGNEEDESDGVIADYEGFYAGKVSEVSNTTVVGVQGNGKYCAIDSTNFKAWLGPDMILLYKVGTPIAENTSAAFDGDAADFGDISDVTATEFTATFTAGTPTPILVDTGVKNSGVKYTADDQDVSKILKMTLVGGFSGSTTKKYSGTFSASIGDTKVCEYTLDLTKQ